MFSLSLAERVRTLDDGRDTRIDAVIILATSSADTKQGMTSPWSVDHSGCVRSPRLRIIHENCASLPGLAEVIQDVVVVSLQVVKLGTVVAIFAISEKI
jgi:hypothetical protein